MSGYDLSGYIDVPSRIALFYKRYPEGSLQMDPIEWVEIEGKRWAIGRGYAYRSPDDPRPGIGTAWEIVPGTTPYTRGSEIQNLETSVWGRAIGALGIGIDKSIATQDEIMHAKERQKVIISSEPTPSDDPFYTLPPVNVEDLPKPHSRAKPIYNYDDPVTPKQLGLLKGTLKKAGASSSDEGLGMINDHLGTSVKQYEQLSKGQASEVIEYYVKQLTNEQA